LAPLRSGDSYRSQQLLKGFAFHGRDVAVVVQENFVTAKLTGDDPPAAAENLKLLVILNADTKLEALYRPKRIVNS
jgi:hypothetical protein